MVRQLIGSLATEWDPKKYHDEYRARVLKLIRDKAKGKEVVLKEAPKAAAVTDIMEALRQSIEATMRGKRPSGVAAEAEGEKEAGVAEAASGGRGGSRDGRSATSSGRRTSQAERTRSRKEAA